MKHKAVHLFATASKLAIGGINFILVKGQKSSPLNANKTEIILEAAPIIRDKVLSPSDH